MSTTMTGARAVISIGKGNSAKIVGIFDSCQYGANIGTEPIHTLGRYSPAEISITSYEAVQVSCSGFRVIGEGVHVVGSAPKLQDLLNFEAVQISVKDRQTDKLIAVIENCVPSAWSESQQAKGTTRFNITYIGTVLSSEGKDKELESQHEDGGTSFP